MLGINENQSFGNPAVIDVFLNIGGDVDEVASSEDVEPQFLAIALLGHFHTVCHW